MSDRRIKEVCTQCKEDAPRLFLACCADALPVRRIGQQGNAPYRSRCACQQLFRATVMKLPELMEGLRAQLQLSELAPEEGGVYWIVFEDSLPVAICPLDENHFLLRYEIAALPVDPGQREAFFRKHLHYNLAHLRDQRSTVSLCTETEQLHLHCTVRGSGLSLNQFLELVEEFVNDAAWWQQTGEDKAAAPALSFMPLNGIVRP